MTTAKEKVLILDFGSQYTQLIARRVRETNVYCEIVPHTTGADEVRAADVKAVILSGSPAFVSQQEAPMCDREIFEAGVPVLGICYGLQVMSHLLGGEVAKGGRREYGHAVVRISGESPLFKGLSGEITVWMSHWDKVTDPPPGFQAVAETESTRYAAIQNREKNLYAVQFHPEVVHTPDGAKVIRNFLYEVCGCVGDWTMESFISSSVEDIRWTAGDGKVLCAMSGGVDSSVLACLLNRAVGGQAVCVFVDNGLLRKNEASGVVERFGKSQQLNLVHVDASDTFLDALKGVVDPEEKRKVIGETFIRVFEKETEKLGEVKFLAQGTLYPDLIESQSPSRGPSATIKSHHNVGGLPEDMDFELIEPLKFLFKDEVRKLGVELGLPEEIVQRHPFPGPGLAVRLPGETTRERLDLLREADAIFIEELKKSGEYGNVWQALVVLLPVRTVGVMGDERTYEDMVALRAVTSEDGMTADWARLPEDLLARVSNRIINEVSGINRVVYDISSKPPSTIEYE